MAATRITTQHITRDGLNPTFEAANVDGHSYVPGPDVFIEVVNAGVGSSIVLLFQQPDAWTRKAAGDAVTVATITVPAGERRRIGPLPGSRFETSAGIGGFGFFATPTSVTVAVFDIPPA
jgi:hypothetical protein